MRPSLLRFVAPALAGLFWLHAPCAMLPAQTTGQFELRKKIAGGFQSYGITPENGKAIGFTAGVPAMITTSAAWADITGKPSTFPPEAHNQAWSTITSTPTTLAGYGIADAITAATAASTYEPIILAGTTSQYWRGDKSWQTLNASAVGLGNVSNALQLVAANNLSDLANAGTARTNLGLGTLATQAANNVAITGGVIQVANFASTGSVSTGSAGSPGHVYFYDIGGTYTVGLRPASLTDHRLITLPNVSGTVITTGDTATVTNSMLANSSITIAGTSKSLGTAITLDEITGLSSTGLVKRTGANTLAIATAGTDYAGIATANSFTAAQTIARTATTGSPGSYFVITTPADTALTASTENIGITKTAATRQWSTGALTTQREIVLAAPTYGFVGASTLTTAINLDIADPIAGTNATITNRFGLRVNNLKITGAVFTEAITGTTGNPILVSTGTRFQVNGPPVLVGGQAAPTAWLEVQATTEQLRLRYDASNYVTFTQSATTGLTIDSTASGTAQITMADNVVLGSGKSVSLNGTTISAGSGSPESVVTATVGSIYLRTDGGASTTLYVKESGSGNTGWIAK